MMRTTRSRSVRALRTGVPAAVIGTLAGALAAVPAQATETGAQGAVGTVQLPTARPATAQKPSSYTVRSGDTVWSIARRHGLRPADVLAWNGIGASALIHPGQKLRLIAPAAKPAAPATADAAERVDASHTVAAGDTVWAIARQHGSTVAAVLAANGLSADSIIYPGQTLRIPARTAEASAPASTAGAPHTELNAKQAENARLIIRIGRELGVPDRGIAIALATSMVESGLRNLDHGDRDSLGLFQQRPSTGWGSPAEIRHRGNSIRAFFVGKGEATRGLLDIPGWQSMRFTDAAQAVQISAYPHRYGQWEQQAYRWLAQHG